MATLSHTDSKRKYSWWWDSHISPKNSKWLQENLTDMDTKVKQMIKLIEEDADSFARRAEMYYKKRPELMKLVEEFYRAYRALAERYDHVTGVLHQAHKSMAEAFPNQVPLVLAEDTPAGSSANETDPHTPEISPIRVIFDPGELNKDALGLSSSHFHAFKRNGDFTEEPSESFGSGEAVSHVNYSEGKARKGLNFQDAGEKERSVQNNGSDHVKARVLSESEQVDKAETVILSLKKTLAILESEKEAGLLQYQQSLERLSALESEFSRAQEDSKRFSQQASQAEAEVQTLKEALAKLVSEREANLLQYQQCMDRIYNLEVEVSRTQKDAGELNERASKAEAEAKTIKQELVRVEGEKEAALAQYKLCSDMISNLEEKLLHAEENVRMINDRANKSQTEVETLKQALARLTEEREATTLLHQQGLETIANLEHKISHSQEEAQRLTCEIDDGVVKLKAAEERCLLLEKSNQTLQSELESLVEKMGSQTEELVEKRKELGRLWTCIQEERMRFVEAETAFQTLQHLHSQSQEELRSLAAELQNRAEILKDMETCNQGLEDEVQRVKEENKSLNELNLSSAVSIKNLQDEIVSLRETIGKLEDEVELRVDQRNALQQEIYCLKEELNELNMKHWAVLEQVESIGYDPVHFESSVKELQDYNSRLKERCEADRSEKVALLEKLEIMDKLKEKNAVLENSHLHLNVELQGVREHVTALAESCESLLGEKSTLVAEKATLISQLQVATVNLEKLSEKNNFLENSLSDASAELEVLRVKFKSLEDSCQLLDNEKSGLITERENLVSQLEITKLRLEDLDNRFIELEYKHTVLENEREFALRKVEELQASLDTAQQEHASLSRSSETQLAGMELQIHILEEEGQCRKKEYEEELDKAVSAQIEIFILQRSVHDLEKETISILIECQNLLQTSRQSEKLISELEHENLEQQMEVKSLFGQIKKLRIGLYRVLKTLDIDTDHHFDDKINQDEVLMSQIACKLLEMQGSFFRSCDENQQLLIEKSVLVTLLEQLKVDAMNLVADRDTLAREFRIQSDQFSLLQMEIQKILGMNEEFRVKVMEGDHGMGVLTTEIENLHGQLDLQRANQNVQGDNFKVLEDKRSLIKEAFDLVEEKRNLNEAYWLLYGDIMSESNLSLIFSNIIVEKFVELKKITEELDKLHSMNNELEGKVRVMEGKLEGVEDDNFKYKESLNKSENELVLLQSISDQLRCEVANGKDLISQKEIELLEAELMFSAITNEKIELHKVLEDLKNNYEEGQVILIDQEKQILKLSAENDHQSQDMECLHEVKLKLESDLCRLQEELGKAKTREKSLSSELQKGRDEIALWETQAATSFAELQISTVCEVLFEGRIQELTIACESLENTNISNDIEIGLLKKRVSSLEGENGGLHAQLAAYTPAVISVKDCISSLEKHTLSNYRLYAAENEKAMDGHLVTHPHTESYQPLYGDRITMVPEGFSGLQDLQRRMKSIEKAVVEMERHAKLEHLNANAKLEAAMREIEELKLQSRLCEENAQISNHVTLHLAEEELGNGHGNELKMGGTRTRKASEARNEALTKDIMLDQISECSPYGISRREIVDADQMLELWRITDRDGGIDQRIGKAQKVATKLTHNQTQPFKRKSSQTSSESFIDKELAVDKLELAGRLAEPRPEGNKRKILERLDSDAQKLANLQITVEDLKRKVGNTENSRKGGKVIEYGPVVGQLDEAEESIMKLFDVNRKLVKTVENGSRSFSGVSATDSDESVNMRRRRISEQARRGSEKIGRLQLEVQKIQFLLLKLDDEKEIRRKTRITERKPRVVLQDYLYGGVSRTKQKRKKAPFCACVRPPTRGD